MRWNVSWIKLTANETHIQKKKKKSCHPIIRFNRLIVNILHFLRFNVFSLFFFLALSSKTVNVDSTRFPYPYQFQLMKQKTSLVEIVLRFVFTFFSFFFFFFPNVAYVGSDRLVDSWSRPKGGGHASSVWQIVRLIV